ncbi:hypothetical protein BTN49_3288 [Candidatus Enterovibrio escicola]|uniref:Uncharacterized protein n=1 Tax=Candidatus Enterovibrio escicola TaxID=1927127 RepID=A0A2A5SZ23_9GAMM|nr:hypothetical protein BTN49_3288 [Candidatus Enterovibrio escacola]
MNGITDLPPSSSQQYIKAFGATLSNSIISNQATIDQDD